MTLGSVLGIHALVAHPDTPPKAIQSVKVQVATGRPGELWIEYAVHPADPLVLPNQTSPGRADDLWETTCFELFVQPSGRSAYLEYNFSPSFEWAAYGFDGYRAGRRNVPSHDPEIAISPGYPYFWLSVEALPYIHDLPCRMGLAAVIEEKDGTKSYWALAHPEGKPDFHHPDSFLLELT